MHVVQIMASAARGGGADHLKGILPVLREREIRCSLVSGLDGSLGEWAQDEGFESVPLDLMKARWSPLMAWRLRRVLHRPQGTTATIEFDDFGPRTLYVARAALEVLDDGVTF